MRRLFSLATLTVVAAGSVLVATAATPAAAAPTTVGSRYTALTPQRVLDSRTTGGAFGQGEVRQLPLSSTVPATAVAVVLNLTATAPSAPGYLTVYPADAARPQASSLNKQAGETRSNSVTVALPANGSRTLDIYNQQGSTQVVVDLLGYYDPTAGSSYYSDLAPERLYDSRDRDGTYVPGQYVSFDPHFNGLDDVTAVALNITAVTPDGPGYLTAWDDSGDPPFVSSVNYEPGRVTPNFAVVPVSADGTGGYRFAVGNNVSDADIVVDFVGVYAAGGEAGSTSFVPVVPQRVSDTRTTGALGQNATYDTPVPDGATAYSANLNVTAVEPSAATFLTVYADDVDRPLASNLNAVPGDVVPNAVQTLIGVDGRYRVYNSQGTVNVVADLEGLFYGDTDAPQVRPAARVLSPTVRATAHRASGAVTGS